MSKDVHGTKVTVEGGTVEGRSREGVVSFLGVPYAAPPFGADRMGPPQPVVPWQGVRDAARMGPTVPKGDYPPAFRRLFPEVEIGGEECLNLLKAGGLPVLVWIHGGSFANGSNSVAACDGSALARSGVVCAAINYRLAAECFLFLDDCLANLGLQDQVTALEWVRDNIAAFGGDPGNVTMAGESAGAMSVATLLAMPSAAGLFARAITQSGAAANTLTAEQGLAVGSLLAEALEVPTTRDAIAAVPQDRLRRAASEVVTEVQLGTAPDKWASLGLRGLSFAPVVDGTVLPVHPLDAARVGAGVPVPLLTGWNRDENRLGLVAVNMLDTVEEFTLLAGAAGTGLGRKRWRSTAPRVPARPPATCSRRSAPTGPTPFRPSSTPKPASPGMPGPPGCTASTTWRRPTTTASARATPPRCRSSSGRRTTTAYGPSSETIPRR
ncbi:carboxylesterase type B [Streptomyces sp. SAI-117]|uniref:carboxylesterase family protein n=1 Tax=Streptomyces sp. SAI-117 TaxID=2940546 RepID=UPI0024743AC2|nr:carboxylesterase family protein [Streptomyces sp. SAI-117]MDH6565094.1 carboxylesterase type B [Streptomyces sp. SAI-117]